MEQKVLPHFPPFCCLLNECLHEILYNNENILFRVFFMQNSICLFIRKRLWKIYLNFLYRLFLSRSIFGATINSFHILSWFIVPFFVCSLKIYIFFFTSIFFTLTIKKDSHAINKKVLMKHKKNFFCPDTFK